MLHASCCTFVVLLSQEFFGPEASQSSLKCVRHLPMEPLWKLLRGHARLLVAVCALLVSLFFAINCFALLVFAINFLYVCNLALLIAIDGGKRQNVWS